MEIGRNFALCAISCVCLWLRYKWSIDVVPMIDVWKESYSWIVSCVLRQLHWRRNWRTCISEAANESCHAFQSFSKTLPLCSQNLSSIRRRLTILLDNTVLLTWRAVLPSLHQIRRSNCRRETSLIKAKTSWRIHEQKPTTRILVTIME